MKNAYVVVNSWDFYLFLLAVFHKPLFTLVKGIIASCDTEIFVIVCWISTYIVISAIKHNSKDKSKY